AARDAVDPDDVFDAKLLDALPRYFDFHQLSQVAGAHRCGTRLEEGEQGVLEFLLGHYADAIPSGRNHAAHAVDEVALRLVVALVAATEDDDALVGVDAGFALAELVDLRRGAGAQRQEGRQRRQ